MNKYIYSIIALLMIVLCPAQMFVSQAEYFWDTDPGAGNGTAVSATDGSFNSAFEQLTKTGIATPGNGLHKLCIRIKDNTGVWGPVFTNVINVQQTPTSTIMALAQAEYFWDTDPGVGNGTPVLAADGNFNSTFEQLTKTGIALPAPGLHIFNVRVKDNTGVWGPLFKNVINVQNPTSVGCWETLSAGISHSIGIKTDGTLWAWGDNSRGQLGDGTIVSTNVPTQIGTANNWLKVFAGSYNTYALKTDGTLWAWGLNEYGQLGDGTKIDRLTPTQIGTATNWKSIAPGQYHTVALRNDGTLWSWGYNSSGQLGIGTTVDKLVPTQIGTETSWQTVTSGWSHSVAIKTNGTLWEWGYNAYAQPMGVGVPLKTNPVQVGTATNWKNVASGREHIIGMKTDGTLWGWGHNAYGQLGDGTTTDRYTPVAIGTETNWQNISAGSVFTFAIKTNGTLWSWGNSYYGQLGNGTSGSTLTTIPTQVGSSSDNVLISAGGSHTLQKNVDGFLKVSGGNEFGQLGDDTNIQKTVFNSIACPSSCTSPTQFSTNNITSSTATLNWAASPSAPNGGYMYFYSTNPIVGGINGTSLSNTVNLSNLLPDTTYYWWVASDCGTSQGNWMSGGTFTTLPSSTTGCWQSVSAGYIHTVGLKADGTLWAWGNNGQGQLGIGSFVSKRIPTQIGTDNNWVKIATGNYHSIALKANGTIWTWGQNSYGQLGDGTTATRTAPVQIGTGTDWVSVASGDNYIVALKSNGTLWAWGRNIRGQLGDGTTIDKSSPVQIGTANNWKTIAPGSEHTFAIKTDGTLWGWGDNLTYQLGDGTQVSKTSPIQIGTATNWKSVAGGSVHSLGIKTDGTLWSWGYNFYGQLGNGTKAINYTPIQVGTETNWRSIVANYDYSSVAIKTDGTLWTWGRNNSGQLGDGTTIDRLIPTKIGDATDRQVIAANVDNIVVINTNGLLSTCGNNTYGQLGDNTNVSKKIFVPVDCPLSNLAVEEASAVSDNLKVFPNPVQDYLNISYDQKIVSVTVYSAAGQLVTSKVINDYKGVVDFSAFSSGVYLVTVNAANNTVKTVKVIKR